MGKRRYKKISAIFLRSWLRALQLGQNAKNRAAIQAVLDDPKKFEKFRESLSIQAGERGIDVDNLLKLIQGLASMLLEIMPLILEIAKLF